MFIHWPLMMLHSLAYATVTGALLAFGIGWLLWSRGFAWLPLILWSLAISAVALAMLFFLAAIFLPSKPIPRPNTNTIRISHLNTLFYSANAFPEKLAFTQTADADIISLVEVPQKLGEILIANSGYPHHHRTSHPSTGNNLPMLTLSRWPLKVAHQWSPRAIAFTVQHPSHPFTLIQLHPHSPYSPSHHQKRNIELATLISPTFPTPTIAVGDFNTTPWDTNLTSLRQSLTFRGPWLPTFPSFMPITPIDLLFSTPTWPHQTLQRLRIPGTDHLALVADFPIPEKTSPTTPTKRKK